MMLNLYTRFQALVRNEEGQDLLDTRCSSR